MTGRSLSWPACWAARSPAAAPPWRPCLQRAQEHRPMPPLHSTNTLNPALLASPCHSYCNITTQYHYHSTLGGHPARIARKTVTLRGRHLLGGISQLSSAASLAAASTLPALTTSTSSHFITFSTFVHTENASCYTDAVKLAVHINTKLHYPATKIFCAE